MKFLCALAVILIFFAELTLDSSTSFVRASAAQSQGAGAAHSALPLAQMPSLFWSEQAAKISFADIQIPYLNPPLSRIERPPIC